MTANDYAANAFSQLALALPGAVPRYSKDAFVRSDSNGVAWRTGAAWASSREPMLLVCGPSGAGKTHFVHALLEGEAVEVQSAAAFITSARDLTDDVSDGAFVHIDDMPGDASPEHGSEEGARTFDPREFLTALESALSTGRRIVISGRGHPAMWANGLRDLKTRLEAAPRAVLADPDEALIRAVIAKGFQDRQIAISPTVIEYAAPRLPLTFDAAHGFVALADQAALEQKRKITAPFVQKLLENLSEREFEA